MADINAMDKARSLLEEPGCTFAAASSDQEITSVERGIRPVLGLITRFGKNGRGMAGWSVADKVVGKAPALLYTMLGPDEIYAGVVTETAADILKDAGIRLTYDVMTDKILRRDGKDLCPMEKTVMSIDDPEEALSAVRIKSEQLMKQRQKEEQAAL